MSAQQMEKKSLISYPLVLAAALLAAIALPVYAGAAVDSENQDVTITVNKGLEMVTPGGDLAATAVTPTGTGDTTSTASSSSISLRSNATWAATVSSNSATASSVRMVENDDRTGGEQLSQALEVSGDGSSYSNLTVSSSPASIKTGQTKNANNTALSYTYYVQQPISWGDESGDYKITLVHGTSN